MTVLVNSTPRYLWQGLSSDSKPTDARVQINDLFLETDTGNTFIYTGAGWVSYPGGAGGVNISAGTNILSKGTAIFSNANGVVFGMNTNGVITASVTAFASATAGIAALVAGANSMTSGSAVFSNSNGVSFGINGQTVTASVAAQTNQTMGLYAVSNTTQSSSGTVDARSLSFGGAGAASVGITGNSVVVSAPVQTNQTGAIYALGNTTGQSSSNTFDARSLSLSFANGASGGWSGNTFIISGATGGGGGGATTLGIYASSNTTGQSSSSTVAASAITIVGDGVVSVGLSNGSLYISSPATTSYAAFSGGFSTGGNTAGNTGLVSGQLVLAGGNNITLSGSTNGASMTLSVIGGAGGGGGSVNFSAGTTSNNLASVTFSNSNGVSFGLNGSTITGSVAAQTNQTLGIYALGNTTQSSSGTVDARSVSLNGLGAMSVGYTNGTIQLSAPATSSLSATGNASISTNGSTISIGANAAAVSIGGNSTSAGAGYSNVSSGTLVLAGGNNVTLSQNGATVTISAAAQTNQTLGLYALGNTTQSSSGTADARSLSFSAGGAISVGVTGGSVVFSGQPQLSFFNAMTGDVTTLTQIGNGSVQVYPILNPEQFSASRADIFFSNSVSSSSNSSHAGAISVYLGLYSRTGSTLSLMSSGSQSYQWTNTSNNSMASVASLRRLSVPFNVNYTGGDVWMAVMSKTATTNANWFTGSNVAIQPQLNGQIQGLIGEASANSKQFLPGYGLWSTTSANLPNSIAFSDISGAGSGGQGANFYMSPVVFANVTA